MRATRDEGKALYRNRTIIVWRWTTNSSSRWQESDKAERHGSMFPYRSSHLDCANMMQRCDDIVRNQISDNIRFIWGFLSHQQNPHPICGSIVVNGGVILCFLYALVHQQSYRGLTGWAGCPGRFSGVGPWPTLTGRMRFLTHDEKKSNFKLN